jgi:hypothetical protein
MKILAQAIGIVTFQLFLIWSKSSSSPKKNIKKIKPKLAISWNAAVLETGQIAADQPGAWPTKDKNYKITFFSSL